MYVLAVLSASPVQQDQHCASTVGLDTILMALYLALLVLQEPPQKVLEVLASVIVPNVRRGLMLQQGHQVVLHAMLDGILNHLDQACVLPV